MDLSAANPLSCPYGLHSLRPGRQAELLIKATRPEALVGVWADWHARWLAMQDELKALGIEATQQVGKETGRLSSWTATLDIPSPRQMLETAATGFKHQQLLTAAAATMSVERRVAVVAAVLAAIRSMAEEQALEPWFLCDGSGVAVWQVLPLPSPSELSAMRQAKRTLLLARALGQAASSAAPSALESKALSSLKAAAKALSSRAAMANAGRQRLLPQEGDFLASLRPDAFLKVTLEGWHV